LLDESIWSKEGIVSSGQLLDELLVLVQLLQVVCGHGIDAEVLRSIQIVLVTEDAIYESDHLSARLTNFQMHHCTIGKPRQNREDVPDRHARTRNARQLDGAGETFVTLRIIVLQANLELDGLKEIPLFLVLRVVQKLLNILAHSGWAKIIIIKSHSLY
jgi:hypothetical protein